MNIVWFKRDLRVYDHEALHEASRRGPVLPIYIFEPELWQQPDLSYRHYQFLCDSLQELSGDLENLGQALIIKTGSVVEVLKELHSVYSIDAVWSHQETWNGWTYQRDIQVKSWLKGKNIPWFEPMQNGVLRRLKNRDGWASKWFRYMNKAIYPRPVGLSKQNILSDVFPTTDALGLFKDEVADIQTGGRAKGLKLLNSFLNSRGEHYSKTMSSPVTAFDSCSRLSPHLAFGTVSIRELFQATEKRKYELRYLNDAKKGKWPSALNSFSSRLRWHCHFIQKLEDEPEIEFKSMHPAYVGLRENSFNESYFEAWKQGKTGFPMVDACMRALIHTGWLNFRMRAMLMSFATHHLWLHWREPALYLARLFTDYEPGIHYSQAQMQSGTTGINSIRIYNPIKQGLDQDPDGKFIRQWIPELYNMPLHAIHTPWEAPMFLDHYPLPIIDEKNARKDAAAVLYNMKKTVDHQQASVRIIKKHASRRNKKTIPKSAKKSNKQQSLF